MNAVRNTSRPTSLATLLIIAAIATSCSKGDAAPAGDAAAAPAPTAQPVSAAAPPPGAAPTAEVSPERELATAADALAGAASAAAPAAPPAAAAIATAPAGPAAAAVERETAKKQMQIEWALKQDEIMNDRSGQWATQATASSTINDAKGKASYSANQATGAPDVQVYSTAAQAWSSKTADSGIEWLQLTFAKPVHATAVRVRENAGSGAVIKIEVFDEKGAAHTVWAGTDATKELNYLMAEFPKTAFKTNRVKVTLATNTVSGWNQIDAVQLVGTD
jgi:hypothetical protein